MANSFKDMISSVDWRKMLTSQDAKNALIGSALGGLMLGGAGLMADRDPDESRLAPVGDALLGALLGGVAGYGIPKGLAMFRDPGGLAPDNDKLRTSRLVPGLVGGAAGAGLVGGGLYRTLRRTARSLGNAAEGFRATDLANWEAARDAAKLRGLPQDRIDYYQRNVDVLGKGPAGVAKANDTLDALRTRIRQLRRSGATVEADRLAGDLRDLVGMHNRARRGYSSFHDLVREVGARGNQLNKPSGFGGNWFKNWTSAKHYHTGKLLRVGPRVGTLGRMGLRAGRYGLAGAALGSLIWPKIVGLSSHNNFRE